MFHNKGVLKNFAKFTGIHIYKSHFFDKIAGLRPATLFKKGTPAQVFSCEFLQKILWTTASDHSTLHTKLKGSCYLI